MKYGIVIAWSFALLISCSDPEVENNHSDTKIVLIDSTIIDPDSTSRDINDIINELNEGDIPSEYNGAFIKQLSLAKNENNEEINDDQWRFTLHYPDSYSKLICARSEDETQLFVFDNNQEIYKRQKINESDSVSVLQITPSQYLQEVSKSMLEYKNHDSDEDLYALQKENLPLAKNVRLVDNKICINTLSDTLIYRNIYEALDDYGGEGEEFYPYYIYLTDLDEDRILLIEPEYGASNLVIINVVTSKEYKISNYGFSSFYVSPNGKFIAISNEGNGYDANYSSGGAIDIYDISQNDFRLIYTSYSASIGKDTQIKWVSDNNFICSTCCQNLSFELNY